MANFGVGFGAFAGGLLGGMQLGKMYREEADKAEIRDASKAALADAKAAREAAVTAEMAKAMGLGAQPGQTAGPGVESYAVPTQNPTVTPVDPNAMAPAASLDPGETVVQPSGPIKAAATPPAPAPKPIETPLAPAASLSPGESAVSATSTTPVNTTSMEIAPAATPAAPVAAGGLPAPMTEKQARALAEKKVPAVMDFFNKNGVPKIAEAYLAQGDAAKAQAWTDYAASQDSQKHMKTWAQMWRASQTGDFESMADHAMDLYKSYDDGVTPVSKEVVKDNDGNVTGFNMKLKNDETGEERSAFIGKDQLMDMGLSALSPPKMFEAVYARQQLQDKAKLDAAAKVGEAKMKLAGDVALEKYKQTGRVELEGVKGNQKIKEDDNKLANDMTRDDNKAKNDRATATANQQNKIATNIETLTAAGYAPEWIKAHLPDIMGVGEYKKRTSPTERRAILLAERIKDPIFAAKKPDQQRAEIDSLMQNIQTDEGDGTTATPSADSTANPFKGGDNPAKGGLPPLQKGQAYYRDTKTGKIVAR